MHAPTTHKECMRRRIFAEVFNNLLCMCVCVCVWMFFGVHFRSRILEAFGLKFIVTLRA